MKTVYTVCLVISGVAALASLACAVFTFVNKKKVKNAFAPARAAFAVLAAALIASVVSGAVYNRELEKMVAPRSSPNRVYVDEVRSDDVLGRYLGAESIPGYSARVSESGDVRFTCHLRSGASDQIMPDFIVFMEYAGGDDPGELYWGAVSAELKKNGEAICTAFVSGDHHTSAMILTGNREADAAELSVLADLYRSGKLTQERISLSLTDGVN